MSKLITLNDVLAAFNPRHGATDYDSRVGALDVNNSKRVAFNDLFVTIMDPEHEDIRDWDEGGWRTLVCLAQDFKGLTPRRE